MRKRGGKKKGKKSQLHYSFIVQSGDGGVSRPFICDLKCCASFDILVFWKLFSQILIDFYSDSGCFFKSSFCPFSFCVVCFLLISLSWTFDVLFMWMLIDSICCMLF